MQIAQKLLRLVQGQPDPEPPPPAPVLRGLEAALHAAPPRGAALRAILSTGPEFPPHLHRRLDAIFGMPVHEHGLRALYQRLQPGLAWHVWLRSPEPQGAYQSYTPTDADTVAYDVEAWHDDERCLHFTRQMHRCPQTGAVDLTTWDLWVHPSLRGLGLTARAEALEVARLQEASSHPDTRLTLAAGDNHQEWRGSWVHARHGYRFARSEDLVKMRQAFSLAMIPHVAQRPVGEVQALVSKLEACREPFDFAQLDLGITVNKKPLSQDVMTQPSVYWFGQRHVRLGADDPVENQERQRALAVFHTSLIHQTHRASQRLASSHPGTRCKPAPAPARSTLAAQAAPSLTRVAG